MVFSQRPSAPQSSLNAEHVKPERLMVLLVVLSLPRLANVDNDNVALADYV
jgi:hypothetical protein